MTANIFKYQISQNIVCPPVMSGKTDSGHIDKEQNTGPTDRQNSSTGKLNMKLYTVKSKEKQFSLFKT